MHGRVRLSVTAHPEGIAELIRAGKRAYEGGESDDDEIELGFLNENPDDRTVWSLSRAIHALSRSIDDDQARGSFGDWLAVEILRDTHCLDVIGGFTHQGLDSLVKLDYPVAEAWARGETSPMDNEALADAAGAASIGHHDARKEPD